jgi:polyisoprenoid-binding protein YceI
VGVGPEVGLGLLGVGVPLIVGGFLAGLFTYFFERSLKSQERRERKAILLESLKRELGFIPDELPAYRPGFSAFLPPIRTTAGSELLDGQTLDWRSDERTIAGLLELLGVVSIYNALATSLNTNQSTDAQGDEGRRHWHSQLLGAHASVLDVRRQLLAALDAQPPVPALEDATSVGVGSGIVTATGSAWSVDSAHSSVRFSARHMGIMDVYGRFGKARLLLNLATNDLLHTSLEAVIDAESIDTGDARRDADLRSDRFLDAVRYPYLTFIGTGVVRRDDNHYELIGDLTIRDATHPITLDVVRHGAARDPSGRERIGFGASTTIARSDWGLTWNMPLETGGWLVSDQVSIMVDVQAVRTGDATAAPTDV